MKYEDLALQLKHSIDVTHCLDLPFTDCGIRILSNSAALLSALQRYFGDFFYAPLKPRLHTSAHYQDGANPIVELELIETNQVAPPLPLRDWPRPADKGRKEAYTDLDDARLLQKVRTGLLFLQGLERGLAIGPLEANLNQVVNFINNQTINVYNRRGWALCHAAAIAGSRGIVAVAGFSGGGKSTLMLHLMAAGDYRFVSNDRLLIAPSDHNVAAVGIAKMPRVNPGTLLNNPKLTHILPDERRRVLCELPKDALWCLEEKYDVPITSAFGAGRTMERGALRAIVILDWHRNDSAPTELSPVAIDTETHLLQALMKSAGPFFADTDDGNNGQANTHVQFLPALETLSTEPYLQALQNVPIYKLSGAADFQAAVNLCEPLLND